MLFGKLALRNDFFKNLIMITPFENWTLCLQNRDFPDKKTEIFQILFTQYIKQRILKALYNECLCI